MKGEKYELLEAQRKMNGEIKTLTDKNSAFDKALRNAATNEKKLVSKVEKLESSKVKRANEELKTQLEALKLEIHNLESESKAQSAALKQNIRQLFEENETLKAAASSSGDVASSSSPSGAPVSSSSAGDDAGVASERVRELEKEVAALKAELEDAKQKQTSSDNQQDPSSSTSTASPPSSSSTPDDGVATQQLMAALQKKDLRIQQAEDDMERLLKKLSESEQETLNIRDELTRSQANLKKIPQLMKDLRAKEEQLKKAQTSSGDSQRVEALQDQLKKLTEGYAALNTRLQSEMKNHKVSKQQLVEAQATIEEKNSELVRVREQCSVLSYNITELKEETEHLKAKHQMQIEEVEKKLKNVEEGTDRRVAETSNAYELKLEDLQAALRAEEKRREQLNDTVHTTNDALRRSEAKLEEVQAEKEKLSEEVATLQNEVDTIQHSITDGAMERKIEAKKRNQMVNSLKAELKKATVRVAELEASVNQKIDANNELQDRIARLEQTLASTERPSASNGNSTSLASSNPALHQRSSSGRGLGLAPKAPTHIAEEVTAALSKRLEAAQEGNFQLKQQIRYLEENVRLLNEDIENKKEVINNYILRIETGALSTSETRNDIARKVQMRAMSGDILQELLAKMEIILQETTLQNVQLRDHKKKLGEEVQRLAQLVPDEAKMSSPSDLPMPTPTKPGRQQANEAVVREFEELEKALREESNQLKMVIRELQTSLQSAEEKCSVLQTQLEEKERELEENKKQLEEAQKAAAAAVAATSAAAVAAESEREKESPSSVVGLSEEEAEELKKQLESITAARDALQASADASVAEVAALSKQLEEKEAKLKEHGATHSELEEVQKQLLTTTTYQKGLEKELEEVRMKLAEHLAKDEEREREREERERERERENENNNISVAVVEDPCASPGPVESEDEADVKEEAGDEPTATVEEDLVADVGSVSESKGEEEGNGEEDGEEDGDNGADVAVTPSDSPTNASNEQGGKKKKKKKNKKRK